MSFVAYLVNHKIWAACGQGCVVIIKFRISGSLKMPLLAAFSYYL